MRILLACWLVAVSPIRSGMSVLAAAVLAAVPFRQVAVAAAPPRRKMTGRGATCSPVGPSFRWEVQSMLIMSVLGEKTTTGDSRFSMSMISIIMPIIKRRRRRRTGAWTRSHRRLQCHRRRRRRRRLLPLCTRTFHPPSASQSITSRKLVRKLPNSAEEPMRSCRAIPACFPRNASATGRTFGSSIRGAASTPPNPTPPIERRTCSVTWRRSCRI
mmetsp:Transcript_22318/g.46287  ORF Transcript_22318/g.46287 Transcript_22318/m.46287 type:complete len:215 (+) Transcript_22318:461-1105(+)